MTRNLYDVGDEPEDTGKWLNESQERRARLIPIGIMFAAVVIAVPVAILIGQSIPATQKTVPPVDAAITQSFRLCDDPKGEACVLTADSYAYKGRRYHVADISVPALIDSRCPQERERAQKGRIALARMLNGGTFYTQPDITDVDASARILRRDGVSIGQLMILKGHARPWSRQPVDWCAVKRR